MRLIPLSELFPRLSWRIEKGFGVIVRLQMCDFSAVLLSLLTKFERGVY